MFNFLVHSVAYPNPAETVTVPKQFRTTVAFPLIPPLQQLPVLDQPALFQSSVSAFVSFHTHCSLSKSRSNLWSCWSRPTTSKTALLSVLFSFLHHKRSVRSSNNPFVPEIISKLSEDSIFLCGVPPKTDTMLITKGFQLVTIS